MRDNIHNAEEERTTHFFIRINTFGREVTVKTRRTAVKLYIDMNVKAEPNPDVSLINETRRRKVVIYYIILP